MLPMDNATNMFFNESSENATIVNWKKNYTSYSTITVLNNELNVIFYSIKKKKQNLVCAQLWNAVRLTNKLKR